MSITATRNTLNTEEYRRKLAGLEDAEKAAPGEHAIFESRAIAMGSAMADLFNRDKLDAINLWSRIASGLEQSARENAGDGAALINGCLLHVLADVNEVAVHAGLCELVAAVSSQDAAWCRQWAKWIVRHLHVVVVKVRAARQAEHEDRKAQRPHRKSSSTSGNAAGDINLNSKDAEAAEGGILQ